MKHFYLPIILISGLVLIVSLVFFNQAQTGASENVSGWAWSDNIGWISFNNITDGSSYNYGVDIDDAGVFSGYAWSDNIGWISFNRVDTGAPPGQPDYSTYLAQLDIDSSQVSGWARALEYGGGWDGWIKLRCYGTECSTSNYGVYIDNGPASLTYQQFFNWAWGSEVVGWISFNVRNCDIDGDGIYEGGAEGAPAGCPSSGAAPDYKVITSFAFNRPPDKPTPPGDYPSGESWNYCGVQELSIPTFHWKYQDQDGDPQTSYEIKIYGETTLNETVTCYTSPCESYTPSNEWIRNNLNWVETYNWQVRTKDNQGNWSEWSDSNSFTMPAHAYPWINFTFAPSSPNVGESIQFTDRTTFYGGTSGSSWSWDFGDATPLSLQQNPSHAYSLAGPYTVKLQTCDNTGAGLGGPYCCSGLAAPYGQKSITVSLPLPEWEEISPF